MASIRRAQLSALKSSLNAVNFLHFSTYSAKALTLIPKESSSAFAAVHSESCPQNQDFAQCSNNQGYHNQHLSPSQYQNQWNIVSNQYSCNNVFSTADLVSLCQEGKVKEAVELIEKGAVADVQCFTLLFESCGNSRKLEDAKKVHDCFLKLNLRSDLWLNNKLIDMYSKCQSMMDARRVFDQMLDRNVETWHLMINGYTLNGMDDDGLSLYEQMKTLGMQRNDIVLTQPKLTPFHTQTESYSNSTTSSSSSESSSVIERVRSLVYEYCRNQENSHFKSAPPKLKLPIGSEFITPEQCITVVASLADEAGSMAALSFFHWAIEYPKFRHFMRLYIVSSMCLMRNGNFERAHEVMNCMVKNFGEIGMLKEAVDMVFEMQNQGLVFSARTLNCIVGTAAEMGWIELAENVFHDMCERGACPDSFCFESMVVGYCKLGRAVDADRWICAMLERGFIVDNATCTLILSVLCQKGFVNRALWIFNKLTELGLTPNLINFTCLIDGLSKRGSVKQAFELLEEMVRKGWKPNVFTHTSLIDGLCKKGWTEKAFRLFLKLVRSDSYKPNVHTYTVMITGYCKEEKLNRAEMLLSRMQEQGLVPNAQTYTSLIDGYCKVGNFGRAYELMEAMKKDGLTLSISTYNSITNGLCKKGETQEAYKLLKKGLKTGLSADLFTYTILMSEYCKNADSRFAFAICCKMVKTGISPDMHTYTTLIAAQCRQKRMKESETLFDDAIKSGLSPTKETFTSMISGYCREKNISSAIKYFETMGDYGCAPDSLTYGALISGLCKASMLDEARKYYDTMMDKGISPSEVTRLTIAYEFCMKEDPSTAMVLLDRLENRLWTRTIDTLIRKLCSEKKVDMATLFFHKLLDKCQSVDRITLTAFMTACYDTHNYSLVSDVNKRIRSRSVSHSHPPD